MSSLSTKANKSRSPRSAKIRATKAKKSALKKPKRPGKITTSPKSRKVAPPKQKQAASRKAVSKKAVSKKPVKAKAAKTGRKPVPKVAASRKASSKIAAKKRLVAKPPPPPKRQPSPGTLAAVRAFEHALRLFNRHDYQGAKRSFDEILKKFEDQAEILAGVRTYLAIIEQRLARAPSIPRNPDALYNQGVFEHNRGNFEDARALFEKALKADPRADHIWYSLAAAYARLNDPQKSLDALRRAIAIRAVHRSHARSDPDFTNLHDNEEFQQLTGFGFDFIEE